MYIYIYIHVFGITCTIKRDSGFLGWDQEGNPGLSYIGIMEKNMETTLMGLYRVSGLGLRGFMEALRLIMRASMENYVG